MTRLQPRDLSDTLEQYVWGDQLEDGKRYAGRNTCGEFKKEAGQVYFMSSMQKVWVQVNPHPSSLFREIVD